jgi:hypothetical protein
MMTRRALAIPGVLLAASLLLPVPVAAAEPTGYEHFHTYAEMKAEIDAAVADHPAIVERFDIGESYEGRTIWGVKISDNVGVDEDEPEVLFESLIHARERLTGEMAMHIIAMLSDGYGSDERITDLVDSREIWIIPMLNPDGAEFDFSGGVFHTWRKNRQPIPGSAQIGVDLNRQFGYMWNCCGGSSGNPASDTYRGPEPWFAPEVVALRDFIDSRVVDGRQQIRASIIFHTAGRMVLWPYGYTKNDGGHERVQGTAGERPVHRRRRSRRLGLLRAPHLRLHLRDGEGRTEALLPDSRRNGGRAGQQPRGGPAHARVCRLPLPCRRT